jgi:hypothetical protein
LAEPGDTITLDEGRFEILGTLSMEGKENIVIRGAGMDQSNAKIQKVKAGYYFTPIITVQYAVQKSTI